MDLKTFIADTLVQIIKGTKEAANKIGKDNEFGCINPQGEKDIVNHAVSFDVALTVEESKDNTQDHSSSTGAEIKIAQIFSIGHKHSKHDTEEMHGLNQSICRVKFDIPIRLPVTADTKKAEQAVAAKKTAVAFSKPANLLSSI